MTAILTEETTGDLDRLFLEANAIQRGSFDKIYRCYKPALVRFATREGARDPEGVADLALFDGFRAFDRMHTPGEPAFRSYVYRALRSHIVGEARQSPVESSMPRARLEDVLGMAAPEPGDFADKLWLDSLLTELTTDQRKVVECRFLLDMSSAVTAEVLEKTPNAVDQLQHRALRRLRQLAFSALILAIFAAGVWAMLELAGGGATFDKGPIDEPMTPLPEQHETQTVEPHDPQFADGHAGGLLIEAPASMAADEGQPVITDQRSATQATAPTQTTPTPSQTTPASAKTTTAPSQTTAPATPAGTPPATTAAVVVLESSPAAAATVPTVTPTPASVSDSTARNQDQTAAKIERLEEWRAKQFAKPQAAADERSDRIEEKFLKREGRILAKASRDRGKSNR